MVVATGVWITLLRSRGSGSLAASGQQSDRTEPEQPEYRRLGHDDVAVLQGKPAAEQVLLERQVADQI
jgi:hypothetical protein